MNLCVNTVAEMPFLRPGCSRKRERTQRSKTNNSKNPCSTQMGEPFYSFEGVVGRFLIVGKSFFFFTDQQGRYFFSQTAILTS